MSNHKQLTVAESFRKELTALIGEKRGAKMDLARAIGVQPQLVSCWLAGRRVPRAELLVALASYYGTSVDRLLGRPAKSEAALRKAGRAGYIDGLKVGANACADLSNRLQELAEKYKGGAL